MVRKTMAEVAEEGTMDKSGHLRYGQTAAPAAELKLQGLESG